MSRLARWGLVAIAAIVILAVAAVAALPRLVDTPRVQTLIASSASHALGRPVRFEAVSVSAFPLPSVDLDGLGNSLGLILSEIERAKDVTARLLVLAQKDESGRSLIDLNHSLVETVSLIRYEASKKGVRLDGETLADPNQPFPHPGVLQVGKRKFLRVK